MAFTIPEGLHPDLNPLAWMIGTWRGKGRGEYPTIETFEYAHEVVFNHDGRPFLNYFSRSWIIDDKGKVREQLMGEQTAEGVLAKLKALRG